MKNKSGFVGIMVANPAQRKYVLKQYLRYNPTNMKIICFTPSSINWKRKSVIGLHRSNRRWVIAIFPLPQVVYNRCYRMNQVMVRRTIAAIGSDRCFNLINQLNKLEMYNSLSRRLDDYLPETVVYSEENVAYLLEKHKEIYLKPFYGHKGKGVYRLELYNTGEVGIGHHYFSPNIIVQDIAQFQETMNKLIGSTPYIIQKGVQIKQVNHQVFDIRALVQKDEKGLWSVTNTVSRIAHKGSYNTSICEKVQLSSEVLERLYPPGQVNSIMTLISDISLETSKILDNSTDYHLGEFSVDFALDNDGYPWIIELNGKPQKALYADMRNQQAVYKRPLQYAHYLCGSIFS